MRSAKWRRTITRNGLEPTFSLTGWHVRSKLALAAIVGYAASIFLAVSMTIDSMNSQLLLLGYHVIVNSLFIASTPIRRSHFRPVVLLTVSYSFVIISTIWHSGLYWEAVLPVINSILSVFLFMVFIGPSIAEDRRAFMAILFFFCCIVVANTVFSLARHEVDLSVDIRARWNTYGAAAAVVLYAMIIIKIPWNLPFAVFSAAVLMFSGSRTSLYGFLVGCFAWVVFSGNWRKNNSIFIFLLAIMVFQSGFWAVSANSPDLVRERLERVISTEQGLSGRKELIGWYWKEICDDLFLPGLGRGTERTTGPVSYDGRVRSSHNTFIERWFNGGLWAAVFYLLFTLSMTIQYRKAMLESKTTGSLDRRLASWSAGFFVAFTLMSVLEIHNLGHVGSSVNGLIMIVVSSGLSVNMLPKRNGRE